MTIALVDDVTRRALHLWTSSDHHGDCGEGGRGKGAGFATGPVRRTCPRRGSKGNGQTMILLKNSLTEPPLLGVYRSFMLLYRHQLITVMLTFHMHFK